MKRTLQEALEQLRGGDPTAWEEVFRHTNAGAYFICKTVFANREAILQAMRTFYVTLLDGLPPAKELGDEATCRATLDAWLFNICKHQLKEENPECFIAHGEDAANAEKYFAKPANSAEEPQPENGTAAKKWMLEIPAEQRLLVLMRYGSGMEPGAIAELLRSPESYVGGQLWLAESAESACNAAAYLRSGYKGTAALNEETTRTLHASIRAGLAERATAMQQSFVPEPAEELLPEAIDEAGGLDLARILRIIGAVTAAVAVLAFAAVAIVTKDKRNDASTPSQSFDFENPYLSQLDDYVYSYTKATTTEPPPLPPTYIIISQEPNTVQPQTQPPQSTTPTDSTTLPTTPPPASEPPPTQPPLTQPPTTHTTGTTPYSYTTKPTTPPPTQPPPATDDDPDLTVEE
ncbi:MAG: hypothetical protein LBS96_04690 [Oscillospiraceae bacterium]|jgi:hypothetical protein|nr:hypothetical protein [Oscillospiraceae bacterium]